MCRAQENTPLASASQPTLFLHSRLVLQSEWSHIVNAHAHPNNTSKLSTCKQLSRSPLRPRVQIPVMLHSQEDRPREEVLAGSGRGPRVVWQRIPKYWVSEVCSRRQPMYSRKAYFFGPRASCSVRNSGCPGRKPILDRIMEALRRVFIQCHVL